MISELTSKVIETPEKGLEMENRIEQEINKTFECMGDSFDIQVSDLFAERLSSRISNIRFSHRVGYRNRAFYPVVIILMVFLNLAVGLMSFKGQDQISGTTGSKVSIMASEYGFAQNSYMNF